MLERFDVTIRWIKAVSRETARTIVTIVSLKVLDKMESVVMWCNPSLKRTVLTSGLLILPLNSVFDSKISAHLYKLERKQLSSPLAYFQE